MMPKIEGKELSDDDLGREVWYISYAAAEPELGVISSVQNGAVFVRFHGPNGERCPPDKLRWVKK